MISCTCHAQGALSQHIAIYICAPDVGQMLQRLRFHEHCCMVAEQLSSCAAFQLCDQAGQACSPALPFQFSFLPGIVAAGHFMLIVCLGLN
jgi:hypothetical protein